MNRLKRGKMRKGLRLACFTELQKRMRLKTELINYIIYVNIVRMTWVTELK